MSCFVNSYAFGAAAPAITFVSNTLSPFGTSITATKPTGTIDGDVIIALVAASAYSSISPHVSSVTPPAGYTLLGSGQYTNEIFEALVDLYVYVKIASSEPATTSWTVTGRSANVILATFRGATGVDVISSPFTTAETNPYTITGITALNPGQLLAIEAHSSSSPQNTVTTNAPAGMTKHFQSILDVAYDYGGISISSKAQAAGATGDVSMSFNRLPSASIGLLLQLK